MWTRRSILVGSVVAIVVTISVLISRPASATDPFFGKVTIVAAPNPNEDGSCPYTLDFHVTAEILKKPFYGVYTWETSADGGKTWDSTSYGTYVIENDFEKDTYQMDITISVPEDDVKDRKKHTYEAKWVYAYGSFRRELKPAVFTCGR